MKDNEHYPTPPDLAVQLVETLLEQFPEERLEEALQVLEPSAGTGSFCEPLSLLGHTVAIDPHFAEPENLPEDVEWGQASLEALAEELAGERVFDIVCGNPPFSLAEAHLRMIFPLVREGGVVGFLLRSGFLSSKKRAPFFQAHPPKHVYILSERPSFVWSWTCKNCKGKWTTPPGDKVSQCASCESADLQCVKTDQYDYMFAVWQNGFSGATTLSWLPLDGDLNDAEVPGAQSDER